MNVEHASARLIDGYARGDTELVADEVWALEAHLEGCRVCRDRLSAAVTVEAPALVALTDAVWSDLEHELAAAVPAPSRRRRTRLSAWATPAMTPWLAMVLAVTALALLLDLVGPGPGQVSLVLLVAPLLPVCGVAASWSRGLDPAYELTASTPRAGLQLVLRRTASVLAVVIPALLAGGWATGVTAAQWLLPCLAFTSMTLALGGVIGVTRAAVAMVAAWAVVVAAPTLATSRTAAALQEGGLPVWALILALGVAVVIARRGAYTVLAANR
ncbi:zf-HC2 domain-containing protein [Streptomyces sp. NBC_01433]|uniref:zf-HC2 domain-containing protein n=1 Tax=Streptomyces sp. NBC_01433 TaxID=2903864 RepID=UPI00225B1C85|nr:zf-HC2 domain-containing protein [Streptomyces sp. NBC_01433]MCX4674901.1 zf-HC2 domain-containing protein [Streptomyces sp. NBC_01433]